MKSTNQKISLYLLAVADMAALQSADFCKHHLRSMSNAISGATSLEMSKQIAAKWRESATLMVLAQDRTKNGFDYKVLMFNRSEKASFMPNSSVFPGGVTEKADESRLWLKYLKNFGVPEDTLIPLTKNLEPKYNIFASNEDENLLHKELSKRITAIRETFEEVGIMICRDRKRLTKMNGYGNYINDFDRTYWQKLVHDDPEQFLELCKKLDVVPDLWSLHEWSAWLTPSTFSKRFETVFYLLALESIPNVIIEKSEVQNYNWRTPSDFITAYFNQELWLPPPQMYELSRLLNAEELCDVVDFAKARASNGTSLMLPVIFECTDGNVSVYPGDDNYPSDPHETEGSLTTHITMEEFRAASKRLHRAEMTGMYNTHIHLNILATNGHITPINLKNRAKL